MVPLMAHDMHWNHGEVKRKAVDRLVKEVHNAAARHGDTVRPCLKVCPSPHPVCGECFSDRIQSVDTSTQQHLALLRTQNPAGYARTAHVSTST